MPSHIFPPSPSVFSGESVLKGFRVCSVWCVTFPRQRYSHGSLAGRRDGKTWIRGLGIRTRSGPGCVLAGSHQAVVNSNMPGPGPGIMKKSTFLSSQGIIENDKKWTGKQNCNFDMPGLPGLNSILAVIFTEPNRVQNLAAGAGSWARSQNF